MRKRLLSGLLVMLLLVEVWAPHVYATETQPLQGEETVMTSPDSGETVSPTMTPDINETASPGIEATASPEESAVPEVTIMPSATVEPEETGEPNATETPEALETPSEQPEESENKKLIQTATPSTSPVQKNSAGPKEEVELVTAAISRTQDEAVSWARSQLGNKLDIDGNGAWCVDLIAYYYQFFGVNTPGGNAQNYAYNALPDGWVRYFNTDSGFSIQPGDIAVWSWNDNHIGIVESADSVGYNMIHQAPSMGEGVRINWYNNSKIYCIIRPNFVNYYDPIGYIDSVQAGVGEFTVAGWALDKDLPTTPTDIHVYLGSGSERECVYSVTANKYRPDVGSAFPGAGDYHGFEFTVKTSKSGYQNLDIFAINIGGGTNNPLLHSQTIYITPDTTSPQITRVWYSDITNHSFRINATVSDNVGVTKVLFPTWRADQTGEQAVWLQGVYQADGSWAVSVDANYWECKESTYYTHVYAYDLAGNYAINNSLNLWLDRTGPTIYGTKWERISDDTIRISCNVDDYYGGVAKVSFPTWTDYNGQDDLKANWDETCIGTQKGNVWSWDVKDSEHNYEKGVYITHIYATDIFGNRTSGGIGYSFENRFIPDTFAYDGHKYEIYNDLLSWSEAKAKCEELGGHLVTINSQGEQDAITQAISSQVRPSYLIGGMTVNGSPTWITGEKFDYTNWCPGEPNNWNGIENVYQLYKDNGKWNDVADVKESMGFICEYEDVGDVPVEDIPAGGIPEGLWMAGLTDCTYTGKEIKPEVRVYDANRLLKKNIDYTISYANNINVNNYIKGKEPTILVKGKGNYSGDIKVTFNILPIDIGGVDFTSDNLAVAYNGKEQKVTPKLQWNGKQLKVNRDFSCEYGSTQAGAYQEVGTYVVRIHGMGNYTGTREVQLSVTENKKQIISNATVSRIKTQTYTGSEICPSLSVTLNGKKLDEGTDYRLSYEKNVQIGTAYIIVQGIGNYSGSKRVSFKITGISMDKVKVENLTSAVYTGEKITPVCQLKYQTSKTESITLQEGTDYNAVYSKNENAGTATVEFIGINGYSGKIKKTFKITPYDMETDVNNCFSFAIPDVVAYEKGGSRPEEEVYYLGRKLVKGTDYTVTYSNNTKISADNAGEKQPAIVIKGKGNFKGTKQFTFRIVKQDIGNVKIVMNAPDKVFQNKKNNYTSKVTVKDANGKTLAAGKDYENIAYFYKNDTTLLNGTVRKAGSEATDKADVVPAGTVMTAKVNGKGNFAGTKSCEYRITKASIGSAKVTIATQSYTGSAITLQKEDIKVTMKGVPVEADEFDIVEGSYKNNVAKGTAKVTIKGKGNYGGTKEVTFKIKAKLFAWWQ